MSSAVILYGYLSIATPAPAHATDPVCGPVDDEVMAVDGMLDDWHGVKGVRGGGTSTDASYSVRCAYDTTRLYVSIDVRDERIIREAKPSPRTDDHVVLRVGLGEPDALPAMISYPGTRRQPPKHTWRGRPPTGDVEIADSLQQKGWSVEIGLPLASISGLGPGAPGLSFSLEYHDADLAKERKIQDVVAIRGTLRFAAATAAYKSFLKHTKLRSRDIRFDELANVDGQPGVERVVAGGRVIGVIGAQYSYIELPVDSAEDVLGVRVVDLAGAGKASLIAELRQHGNGGSRDVVAVWNLLADGSYSRALAFEVRKQMGDRSLANTWKLVPRQPPRAKGKQRSPKGKTAGNGYDIVVEAGEVVGWDEDSYEEAPAQDVRPILLPWEDDTSAVYHFEGDTAHGGEPLSRR